MTSYAQNKLLCFVILIKWCVKLDHRTPAAYSHTKLFLTVFYLKSFYAFYITSLLNDKDSIQIFLKCRRSFQLGFIKILNIRTINVEYFKYYTIFIKELSKNTELLYIIYLLTIYILYSRKHLINQMTKNIFFNGIFRVYMS